MAEQRVTILSEFQDQLEERSAQFATLLPPTISREVFVEVLLSAVRANPDLLTKYDRRNLFAEVTKAATDGIRLNGKEGALVPRKGVLVYQPMVEGIRRRARELDNLILDAKCVRENDGWEHEEGDDAYIKHTPLPEWKGPRGKLVAAYLIVRQFNPGADREVILHREVMYAKDVMAVKSISKQQDAPHWTIFEEEGWKKSVVHRGIKSVPSITSSALKTILSRDYEEFDLEKGKAGPFDGLPPSSKTALPLPPPSSKPATPPAATKPAEPSKPASEPPKEEKRFATVYLDRLDAALEKATTLKAAQDIYKKGDDTIERDERFTDQDRDRAYKIWDKHEKRLTPAKKKKAAA